RVVSLAFRGLQPSSDLVAQAQAVVEVLLGLLATAGERRDEAPHPVAIGSPEPVITAEEGRHRAMTVRVRLFQLPQTRLGLSQSQTADREELCLLHLLRDRDAVTIEVHGFGP